MHGQHNHCLHALNVCEQCDTVYCMRCNREWRGHSATVSWYPNWPVYGTTTIPCDTIAGLTDSGGSYATINDMDITLTHAHN